MTNPPIAYAWEGMEFCPECALRSTAAGMVIGGLPRPQDMDEAIASIALSQIERGLPIHTPVAVATPSVEACESCGKTFNREEASK